VDNLSLKIKNLFDLHNKHLIKVGPLEINIDSRELYIDGTKKEVTLKEFELLVYLIKNKGKAVSREQIFKDVWGYENFSTDDRTIDTHIKMLRNELSEYKNFIETYR
jgi:DNA-binding response OmpR family regulator